MLSLLTCSTLPTGCGSFVAGKHMQLSQSSKQGFIVMYLRSSPAIGHMLTTEQCVALGAASYVHAWVGRLLR